MNKINHIHGTNLYIGNWFGASDEKQLLGNNIKYIFNFSYFSLRKFPGITYYDINILDHPDQNILQFFDSVFRKIDTLRYGNILVNCQAGISRSASMIIGYLIRKGFSYDQSYNMIKKARHIINPNHGFVDQLKFYERAIKNR
jgi:protein-tyrosine phosphatase